MANAPTDADAARKPSVSVRDVAELAGVSLGTVSNVLNRPERVGEGIRLRVQQAMGDLGFVPSRAAGQLRGRNSELIGVVVPDVGNPFWAEVLRGVEHVADEIGVAMVVGSTHQDRERQAHILRVLQSQGVDGLIIAPIAPQPSAWEPFHSRRFGVVALGRSPSEQGAWVSLDDAGGAAMAMGHLLKLGHRRVALINGPSYVSWCAERHRGAVDIIVEYGIDPDEALVEVPVSDLTVEEGITAAGPLLDAGEVTAIMCVNDMLALGVLLAAQQRALRVPDDVSVVGFDDADFTAALNPPLTTINQPSFDMGRSAAEMLVRPGGRKAGEHISFEPQLVERNSTAPPRT